MDPSESLSCARGGNKPPRRKHSTNTIGASPLTTAGDANTVISILPSLINILISIVRIPFAFLSVILHPIFKLISILAFLVVFLDLIILTAFLRVVIKLITIHLHIVNGRWS